MTNENKAEEKTIREPEIIFEDDNFLIINKPAGLAVHPGGNIKGETLKDWVIKNFPKIKGVGEDEDRPGIIHRLDMEVSGLMVVAKTQKSFNHLKKQFQERKVEKEYFALVHGNPAKENDLIDFAIKRSKSGYKMAAIPKNVEDLLTRKGPKNRDIGNLDALFKAREAITEFSVVRRFVNYSLLKVRIYTGRTHQIRVHLFAYGHPLVGDPLYYTKKTKVKNQKFSLNRIFLFSSKLGFLNLDKKKVDFSLKMPKELEEKLPKN